ncbi:glutathione S-transferase family protein [Aureimonas mangrovi]|uniref:glutathione S-transferase family protein n=1 Tax=Aureimonas mangrovi TaxID=2758041 RepID=UPI00163D808C|nr:glutathione S-transferase family protein [Aureimonas mangrovi]
MTILFYDLVGSDAGRPFSPHCWKTRMALAHKGLPFESVPTPFTGVKTMEGGTDRTIPVIRDGDTVVQDSFAIAEYLEATYPDRPTLFAGEGGRAAARFVEAWSFKTLHPLVTQIALMDIFDMLDEPDRAHFRRTREQRFGRRLEEVPCGAAPERIAALNAALEPLRTMLGHQPFIGGSSPLFADYIVFGALQWLRVSSPANVLAPDDLVTDWFTRCLDLHEGAGRKVEPAKAA